MIGHIPRAFPLNLKDKATIRLRSNGKQGNFKPQLDTADIAVCEVVEEHILKLTERVMRLEAERRGDD